MRDRNGGTGGWARGQAQGQDERWSVPTVGGQVHRGPRCSGHTWEHASYGDA